MDGTTDVILNEGSQMEKDKYHMIYGEIISKNVDEFICITDSVWYTAETNTTL